MEQHNRVIVICGHYGSGKTNYALNLAVSLAKEGESVTLADLDIVNPYFRSADHKELAKQYNIRLIVPEFAGTNVDIPVIPPEINCVFEGTQTAILDVGGDDAGAVVLGRFHEQMRACDYEMRYVVNCYRSLMNTPEETQKNLREIEMASRLYVTSLVGNSHLKQQTTKETIIKALPYTEEVMRLTQLPLLQLTCPFHCYEEVKESVQIVQWLEKHPHTSLYPVHTYVRTPWETGC